MDFIERHLIENIPSGRMEKSSSHFAILERFARKTVSSGVLVNDGKTFLRRWFGYAPLRSANRRLRQYGWEINKEGALVPGPVIPMITGNFSHQQHEVMDDEPTPPPFETGRIQVRAGYVVDTFTGRKCQPKDLYRLKNIYG